jgi:Uma2 family endonuclease
MPLVRYSVDDYEQMIERGILTENDRVELIRGEIVDKMSIGDRHAACVNRLNRLLGKKAGDTAIVAIQNPVRLADSEPEPDVALLRPRGDFYATGKPEPADVLLAIEVADSSLDYDRDVKRPMYGEAGIAEYWIVNLIDECLEVHRQPQPDGTYRDVQTLRRGQQVDVALLPAITMHVDELL